MTRTAEQIQQEIDSLNIELIEIKKKSDLLLDQKASIERQERELFSRLKEIRGFRDWSGSEPGLIADLQLELKESQFPVYEGDWRIVSVTDKTIGLKRNSCSFDDVLRYNRDTGWKSRTRSDWGAIDAKKALQIWENHHAI